MTGLGTRLLTVEIDGADYTAEVSRALIVSAAMSDDRRSMCSPARAYDLEFTAVQDMAPGSLWGIVWSAAERLVPCLLKPYGNATPSESEPHFSFTAVVKDPDGVILGGEADAAPTARQVFECVWPLEAKPVKVTS